MRLTNKRPLSAQFLPIYHGVETMFNTRLSGFWQLPNGKHYQFLHQICDGVAV